MQFEKNIIHRPETSNLYDDQPSLGHLIIKNLLASGDKTLIVCGLTGKQISAREVLNKSIEIAKALIVHGIRQGDIVSIISENRFEFVYAILGTIFINCPLAPLNHTYSKRELIHALNLSKPNFIFTSGSTAKIIGDVAGGLGYVKKIILFDEEDGGDVPPNQLTIGLSAFTNRDLLKNVEFRPSPINVATATCLIMCSSGTTGLPKVLFKSLF